MDLKPLIACEAEPAVSALKPMPRACPRYKITATGYEHSSLWACRGGRGGEKRRHSKSWSQLLKTCHEYKDFPDIIDNPGSASTSTKGSEILSCLYLDMKQILFWITKKTWE